MPLPNAFSQNIPATNQSKITTLIPAEFQLGNLWFCLSQVPVRNGHDLPINSLGFYLSDCVAPNCRK